MSNELAISLVIVLLMLIVYYIMIAFGNNSAKRKYKKIYQSEVSSAAFADARRTLFEYVMQKKIDIHSNDFQTLYAFNTFFMRRPDQYESFAPLFSVLHTFVKQKKSDNTKNLENLGEELKIVYNKTSRAIDKIVIHHSSISKSLLILVRIVLEFSKPVSAKILNRVPYFLRNVYDFLRNESLKQDIEDQRNSAKKALQELTVC